MKYESYYGLIKHFYSQLYFSFLYVIKSMIGIVFILNVFVVLTVIPITLHNNMNTYTVVITHVHFLYHISS